MVNGGRCACQADENCTLTIVAGIPLAFVCTKQDALLSCMQAQSEYVKVSLDVEVRTLPIAGRQWKGRARANRQSRFGTLTMLDLAAVATFVELLVCKRPSCHQLGQRQAKELFESGTVTAALIFQVDLCMR